VKKYTKQFDRLDIENFLVTKAQIQDAYKQVSEEDLSTLKEAAKNIEFFAREQMKTFQDFEVQNN
jgi:histidinol dehydrogenase